MTYIFTEFGRLGFYIIFYVVMLVKFVRIIFILNKFPVVRKCNVILLGFILFYRLKVIIFPIIVIQYVRK